MKVKFIVKIGPKTTRQMKLMVGRGKTQNCVTVNYKILKGNREKKGLYTLNLPNDEKIFF